MPTRSAFAVAALLVFGLVPATIPPTVAAAESAPPEALLAKESVAYVRYDGLASQRAAYSKTITGSLLQNEFGPLIDDLVGRVTSALGPEALGERLLDGVEPDQLLKVQVALKQLPHLWEYLDQHGFAAGLEVLEVVVQEQVPPKFQLTVVFPDGGEPENRAALFGGLQLIGLANEVDVVETKVGDRTMLSLETGEDVAVLAWQEGPHVVLTVGTLDPKHTLDLAAGKRETLLANGAYSEIEKFDGYATTARGFFDVDRVRQIAVDAFPPAGEMIDGLGLDNLKNVRFHAGFEDSLVRTTLVLDAPDERQGLLQILAPGGEVDVDDLPPLPADSAAVLVSTIDLAGTYDELFGTIDRTLGVFAPFVKPQIESGIAEMKKVLGVDLRADILATLDSPVVYFNAASDGPLNLGSGVAIRVKDPERLEKSLETIARSIGAFAGVNVSVQTRDLHGVKLHMISTTQEGFPFKPTYAIHDGWFVGGFYPQTVQGFAYRTQETSSTGGEPRRWTMPPVVESAIEDALAGREGARMTGLYVTDPRPTAQSVLSMSPFLVQMVSQFSGGTDFDISLIPNSQSVTDPLHENVTVVVDDGKTIRYEGYASLPLPLQLTGIEAYAYIGVFSYLSFAF